MGTVISIAAALIISIVEIFVITRWIRRREVGRAQESWTPFRIVFLDSLLKYAIHMHYSAESFSRRMDEMASEIKSSGRVTKDDIDRIVAFVASFRDHINYKKTEFYFVLQTVSPALQPYAAELCNEVIWFDWAVSKSLDSIDENVSTLAELDYLNNESAERPLTHLFSSPAMMSIYFMRFSQFPNNLIKMAKEKEQLYFSERHGGFMSQLDFEREKRSEELDREFSEFEKKNPRTMPIKEFWDTEESWKDKLGKLQK